MHRIRLSIRRPPATSQTRGGGGGEGSGAGIGAPAVGSADAIGVGIKPDQCAQRALTLLKTCETVIVRIRKSNHSDQLSM